MPCFTARKLQPEGRKRAQRERGVALYSSPHFVFSSSLHLDALNGYGSAFLGAVDLLHYQIRLRLVGVGGSIRPALESGRGLGVAGSVQFVDLPGDLYCKSGSRAHRIARIGFLLLAIARCIEQPSRPA